MYRVLRLSLSALLSLSASAGTISEWLGGTMVCSCLYQDGQMVVTPAGGPWDNITFCFGGPSGCYSLSPANSNLAGRLYLLSQEYAGTPDDLAVAPSLIAISEAGYQTAWIFDSSVVLPPNTAYYFYEDGGLDGAIGFPGKDPIAPFPGYLAEGLNSPFGNGPSNDYVLTGDPVPEPSPLTLLALGLLPLLLARRRRRRAS